MPWYDVQQNFISFDGHESDVCQSFGDIFLESVYFAPLGLLIVLVEDHSIFLELKYVFKVETVQNPSDVNIVLSLFRLTFERFYFDMILHKFQVISEIFLIYFLVERTVLIIDHLLCFRIQVFDFILDSVVNTLIKDPKTSYSFQTQT